VSLKVYNTLRRKKQIFEPINEGRVKMYVCGPTVYNYISIGNARPVIIFNMVKNYLQYLGYSVEYIQNITDIEDKIIKKAQDENVDYRIITSRYINAFMEDLKDLEVGGFTKMPLATEMITEIIDIIERIIENGYGYVADGDVYFEVSKFSDYGKLSGQDINEMRGSEEEDSLKKNRIDFALWKKTKEGEPFWESPWGEGRPGWHIECSAMATTLLGRNIDIHGGGIDLVFPHHENEIAQSEAAYPDSGDFVKYWMHNGMIEVKEGKMSKSLGLKENWILKNLLKIYPANVIKMYVLSTHYRSPLEFSMEKLGEAERAFERITNTLKNIKFLVEEADYPSASKGEESKEQGDELALKLRSFIEKFEDDFKFSMDDDFNSARAIGDMFEFVKNINNVIQKPDFEINAAIKKSLDGAYGKIKELGAVFGFNFKDDAIVMTGYEEAGEAMTASEIEEKIKERESARKAGDYKKADEIRSYLKDKGVLLEDRKEGTIWEIKGKKDSE
jgi:cysteinyl-tRNA synthetase